MMNIRPMRVLVCYTRVGCLGVEGLGLCAPVAHSSLPAPDHANHAVQRVLQGRFLRQQQPSTASGSRHVHTRASDGAAMQRIAKQQEQAACRPPRFYLPPPSPLAAHVSEVLLEGEEARHALRVLRLREGDRVELCDGQGRLMQCVLTSADKAKHRAWLAASGPVQFHPWCGPRWCLAVACTTLKGGRAEWMVEKATELGAAEVIPLITERSQPSATSRGNKYKRASSPEDTDSYEPGRLERVAIAATKQCLREHGLTLCAPLTVKELVEQRFPSAERILLAVAGAPPVCEVLSAWAPGGQQQPCDSLIVNGAIPTSDSSVLQTGPSRLLLVGPEGDWTPGELEMLTSGGDGSPGAEPVGLGRHRLRTETAAIALLAAASLWREK